jgi:hypothetical protein
MSTPQERALALDLAIKAGGLKTPSELVSTAQEFETYITGSEHAPTDSATVDNPTNVETNVVTLERRKQQQLELEINCARCGALHIVDMEYDHPYESPRESIERKPDKNPKCLDCKRDANDPRHNPNNLEHGGHAFRPSPLHQV